MSASTSLRYSQVSPEILKQTGQPYAGDFVTIDSLTIGTTLLQDIRCHVNEDLVLLEPETDAPIDFILGLNEIRDFLFTIDFCDKKLYL